MTTIVRRMDDLGRVVIPKEMRTQLDLVSGTPIEIIGAEDGILLRKKQEEPLAERVRRLREEAIREEADRWPWSTWTSCWPPWRREHVGEIAKKPPRPVRSTGVVECGSGAGGISAGAGRVFEIGGNLWLFPIWMRRFG